MADIVLPVTSAFEHEALRFGFEVSPEAQSLVQLRRKVAEPRGECRSDVAIVFDLACRLGLGEHFWGGDIDAAMRHQLAPSSVTLEELRAQPGGIRLPLETRHRKFAATKDGVAVGFSTPSGKIELWSETFRRHGQPPLPDFVPPLVSADARFPLVLTCAKSTYFCETQHRGLASLRRKVRDPEVEMHPEAAAARSVAAGDWVRIVTWLGSVRARVRLNESLDPQVVCGQHGWWEACPEVGAPGYPPFSEDGANFNLLIGFEALDPVSGSVPMRAYACEIERA
jgi:anaerobic selenocysteine-containing dehydrogenase